MKTILLSILLTFLASSLFGQATPSPSPASSFDAELLGGKDPILTAEEQVGVNITQAWRDKSLETMVGSPGKNASIQFRFGESYPSIVCAVLQVTDVELEKGETATHINVGDATRWSVESAMSGSGAEAVQHIIIKPRDKGLETSLIITTDRRTYHLLLVSDGKAFCHDVTFLYPTPPPALAAATPVPSPAVDKDPPKDPPRREKQALGKEVVANDPPDDADDNYIVRGRANFAPVNVYTKAGKTYLELPSSVKHRDIPVLFEERKSGLFGHSKNLCNYRVHGRWLVVDKILDDAVLVSGVGSGQEKVTVRHAKRKETEVAHE